MWTKLLQKALFSPISSFKKCIIICSACSSLQFRNWLLYCLKICINWVRRWNEGLFVKKVTFVCWMNYISRTYLFLADQVKPFRCQCRLRRPSCRDNKGREDKLKCRSTSTFRRTMENIRNGYVWIKKRSNMKIY